MLPTDEPSQPYFPLLHLLAPLKTCWAPHPHPTHPPTHVQAVCDRHDPTWYDKMKTNCDDYFQM